MVITAERRGKGKWPARAPFELVPVTVLHSPGDRVFPGYRVAGGIHLWYHDHG